MNYHCNRPISAETFPDATANTADDACLDNDDAWPGVFGVESRV